MAWQDEMSKAERKAYRQKMAEKLEGPRRVEGPAPAPVAGPGPAGIVSNTTQTDPYLTRHADRVEDRVKNFGASTGRAIDMASSKLRDLGEGRLSAISSRMSRAGTYGSGAQVQAELENEFDIGRQVEGAAADITLGRERDQDAFMLGATGALGAPGAAARGDRALNLQQWETGEANRRALESQNLARQVAVLNALQSAPAVPSYDFGGGGGYAPGRTRGTAGTAPTNRYGINTGYTSNAGAY